MKTLDVVKEGLIEIFTEDISNCPETGCELKISDLQDFLGLVKKAKTLEDVDKLCKNYSAYDTDVYFWEIINSLNLKD